MTSNWFDDFRLVYADWWADLSARFDDDPTFEPCRVDTLAPVADLAPFEKAFGPLPAQLRTFLTKVGCGDFFFPIPGEEWADELRVFDLGEALERVESVKQHALREIEELDEWGCEVHDDAEACGCRAALADLAADAMKFYPLFGPAHVFDFVYVVISGPQKGHVGHWYHDYPALELLDGSYDFPTLAAYGAEFVHLARTGGQPI